MESKPRTCLKCKGDKTTLDFYKDSSRSDGLHPYCKTCNEVKRKAWYAANKEKALQHTKDWIKNNKDRKKEISRNWWKRNKAYAEDRYLHRKDINPDRFDAMRCEQSIRIRARKYGCEMGDLKEVQAFYIWVKSASYMECGYCKKSMENKKDRQIDHIVSIFHKGNHAVSNLTPSCKECNQSKNRRTVQDFLSGIYAVKKNYSKKKKDKNHAELRA